MCYKAGSFPITTGLKVYVLNTHEFGYLLHPTKYDSLQEAADAFTDYKLKTLGEHDLESGDFISIMLCTSVFHPLIPRSENIPAPSKPKDNVGLDAVSWLWPLPHHCLLRCGYDVILGVHDQFGTEAGEKEPYAGVPGRAGVQLYPV